LKFEGSFNTVSIQERIKIMPCLSYRDAYLYMEDVRLETVAEEFGHPIWVYSLAALKGQHRRLEESFGDVLELIATSVKANGNLHLIGEVVKLGAGADITHSNELQLALMAGVEPSKIVFAGVGKTEEQIRSALETGILMFNVESKDELYDINRIAGAMGKQAPISIRVNPNVDGYTHEMTTTGLYTNKFGIEADKAFELALFANEAPALDLVGLQIHIGSPIYDLGRVVHAFLKLEELYVQLLERGVSVKYFDLGGQLPIDYGDGKYGPASTPEYLAKQIVPRLQHFGVKLILEPGRFLFGPAGVLISQVIRLKSNPVKNFLIQSTSMNDWIRGPLYKSHQELVPLVDYGRRESDFDVVSWVCETSDRVDENCRLPTLIGGEHLALLSAGAYGRSMSLDEYNGGYPAAEVLVDGHQFHLIRRRETFEEHIRPMLEV
jgi:diaminopimelate decarboxylase